jgi:RecA/RadA recombinase
MLDKKVSKIVEKLRSHENAVNMDTNVNIHDTVVRSASPSVNFIFGNGHGLPYGHALLLYGPPRGGKSVLINSMIGQLHKDDPEAIAVKFNTEFREGGQLNRQTAEMYGIDFDRYLPYETNHPAGIFDYIRKEIACAIQDGAKIKLVAIDSVNQIVGRRADADDTMMTQQRGDVALTIQEGLKSIIEMQHKLGFALILTSHIRMEQDPMKAKKSTIRPAVSLYTQHHCEYYIHVQPVGNSALRDADLLGNKFEHAGAKDVIGNSERSGHRVKATMMDSSLGPKGRVAQFTFDYNKGIINTHEEVFLLGVNRGIIKKPNLQTYSYNGVDYRGKPAMLEELRTNSEMCKEIMNELRLRDMARDYGDVPADLETTVEDVE